MLSSKLGWREIRQRPGRAALTLMSVVIGVAAVVAVTFTTRTTRTAFDQIYQSIAGKAALEVSAPVGDTIDESVLATVQSAPGVQIASPVIQRRTVMYLEGRRIQLLGMGVVPERDRVVHNYKIEAGKGLSDLKDIVLSSGFAKSMGVKLNDRVELLTRAGRVKTRVIGLYSSGGTAMTGQGAVMLMPLRVAQEWFKARRRLDGIQIVLNADADEAQVSAEIAKRLPANATVHRPAARSRMAEETSLSTEQGLNMGRALSLLVSVFIIINTFLISVTQRRRQFGIMRAIGATKRQIAQLVLSQALTLGVVGTALGALLGVAAAHYLTRAMGSLYSTTLPPLELTPAPFAWAIVFGVGISLAGAAFPAYKAMKLSPLDAIRDVASGELEGTSRWLIFGGGGLILFCGTVLTLSILGKIPMSHAVWSSVVSLVGVGLLLPLALRPLAEGVAALLPTKMRVETRLASRYLLAHRARTTLTVIVVFAAITAGVGLANSVMDNVQDVRDWYKKTIVADFFVRATTPDMSTGLAADMPDEVDGEIREIPGIISIEPIRLVAAKAADQQVVLIIRGFADPKLQEFEVVTGDPATVRQSLQEGGAVIGSVLAERTKLKVGEKISLTTDQGAKEFNIAAVVNDYQAGGLTMYLARDVAKRVLGIGGVDAFAIQADHKQLAEVRTSLDELCQEHGLLLQSFSDIQQTIDGMMSGVVAGLWGMVVLGLLVAAFGVANTLTMSVLEQTFELGLLRIVASTRGQVRTIIFAQAAMIGLLALVPGVAAGVSVGYLIHLATLPVIGHPVQFEVHPWLLAGGLAAGMAVVMIAAWGPAERAARIELLEALRLR
jgi:putative ABC transport system permease protein